MPTVAIVPVKAFHSAKSRLAEVLSPGERQRLSREFFVHTLNVLAQLPDIDRTLVVSHDEDALAMARARSVETLKERPRSDLNAALTQAARVALASLAEAVFIVATDLPLLTASEVGELLRPDDRLRQVVISPDRRERGTNLMLVRPPLLFEFAYGPDSFREHARRAGASGASVRVCRLPGASLDVDEPEDLALYRETIARVT